MRNQDDEFEYNGPDNPCLEVLSPAKAPVKAPVVVEPDPIPPGFSVPVPEEVPEPEEVVVPKPAPAKVVANKKGKK
jgi:hypothetical protein